MSAEDRADLRWLLGPEILETIELQRLLGPEILGAVARLVRALEAVHEADQQPPPRLGTSSAAHALVDAVIEAESEVAGLLCERLAPGSLDGFS